MFSQASFRGIILVGLGYLALRLWRSKATGDRTGELEPIKQRLDPVDEASMQSFPASDPPSFR